MIHSKKSFEYKPILLPNMQSRLLHYHTKHTPPTHIMQTTNKLQNYDELQSLKEKISNQATLIYDLEMIIEEKTIQFDDLHHESQTMKQEYHTKTDEMQADIQRMHADFLEEKHTLEKEAFYYKCRVQQEQVLSRQLLQQIEELQKNQKPNHIHNDTHHDTTQTTESICIVCNEHHDSYEPMNCNHLLCTDCFVNWYSRCINYNQNLYEFEEAAVFTCPMCRTPIDIRSS